MRFFLAGLLLLQLQGCIPAPYGPYYKPSYPDSSAALIKEYCQGQAGPPAILTFTGPEEVRFSVSAARKYMLDDKRADRPLRISINVPAGTQFQFLTDGIGISDKAGDPGMLMRPDMEVNAATTFATDTAFDFDKLAPTSTLAAATSPEAKAGKMLGKMHIYLPDIRNFVPRRFQLQFPPLQLDTGVQVFPAQTLHTENYGNHGYVYQTDEYRKALEDRRDACLKNTPAKNCQYIVELNSDSLQHRSGNFTLNGRFYVFNTADHSPFAASIELTFHSTASWRISDPVIRLKDLNSGEQHDYKITQMPLWFDYTVPLTTPVRGVGNSASARTTLYIDTSLGSKMAPHYFVQLPSLRINGHDYTLKPIELELRLLDGGIEPFNC